MSIHLSTGTLGAVPDARRLFTRSQGPAKIRIAEPDGGLPGLESIAKTVLVRRGQTLFRDGDPAQRCFRVVTGAIRSVRLLPDGRRQIGDFLLADDFFGLGHGGFHRYTAEAIVDSALICYPRQRLDQTIAEQPSLGKALLDAMSSRLAEAHLQLQMLGCMKAEQRLAAFLLAMSVRCGTGDIVRLPMTRADIADYLGLSIETVSRSATKLCDKGLIVMRSSGNIRFADRAALEAFAEGC